MRQWDGLAVKALGPAWGPEFDYWISHKGGRRESIPQFSDSPDHCPPPHLPKHPKTNFWPGQNQEKGEKKFKLQIDKN